MAFAELDLAALHRSYARSGSWGPFDVKKRSASDVDVDVAATTVAKPLAGDTMAYQAEFFRRSILFLDILRVRANNMLAHEQAGLPPLLDFEYETLFDARRFERPANYALLHITGCGEDTAKDCERPGARPVIIIDPRAGHGPGMGGFKHDSEVGMSLHEGHPTYFVIFHPEPCPGQTLADVLHALRRFVDEVARRHPKTAPTVYGNCQGGWAAALLAATHDGLIGPTVMNGSPLSYWAGEADVNPMRLSGGLLGGTWLTHFMSDLGDGRLDGAWLAENYETPQSRQHPLGKKLQRVPGCRRRARTLPRIRALVERLLFPRPRGDGGHHGEPVYR